MISPIPEEPVDPANGWMDVTRSHPNDDIVKTLLARPRCAKRKLAGPGLANTKMRALLCLSCCQSSFFSLGGCGFVSFFSVTDRREHACENRF
jgi:hypothetical protein